MTASTGDPVASDRALARLRMPLDEAREAVARLDGTPDGGRALMDALVAAAHPPTALRTLERFADAAPERWTGVRADPEQLTRMSVIAGVSDALADLMVAEPGLVHSLVDGLEACTAEDHRIDAWAALCDHDEEVVAAEALARVQRAGILRIAARDLLGFADTPDTTRELSALATGVVRAALAWVQRAQPADDTRLAVIAMGKLGAGELNYVSDIDVMFVHDGDRVVATRWATALLSLLGAMTPLGMTYEVDTNLRPEGRDGQLVRTLEGFRSYYDRWARTWEQQALLKSHPLAGDESLGADFGAMVEPFVWPDTRAGDTVGEIQKMKTVVEHSDRVRRAGDREVKLAPGGLRDIEFAVQLLQLVHGRHDTALRERDTLGGLDALSRGRYVDEGDANLFADAYIFLRTIEHRLQLRALRRTHVLPKDDDERYRLARACGFRDLRSVTALEQFDRERTRVRASVRRLHEKLFYRPLLERFAEVSRDEARAVGGGDGGFDDAAAADRLAALGFSAPGRSITHLRALATGTTRADALLRTALPTMLPTLARGPDPDTGLLALRTMAERLEHAPSFLAALRDAPVVGQVLAEVLSKSRLTGEWLERQPEVFTSLSDIARLDEALTPDEFRAVALGLVRRGGGRSEVAAALRRFKRREVARIAVRDLTGRADASTVALELTGLADACLEAALTAVIGGQDLRMAVLALGKLGGQALGYRSDLDVILVFDPPGARDEALEGVEDLLQMLSSITPEGQAFTVDLKLRPEGRDGPLARTLSSTVSYYRRWAEPWELFAMTRARVVAGDEELGAALIDEIADQVWPAELSEPYLRQVRTMKARIERERSAGGGGDGPIDVKLGAGGLTDIEWTAQLLSARHGAAHPRMRTPGTLTALSAAADIGLLPGEEAVWLRRAWELLTDVRNGRYLSGARHADRVPADPEERRRLAMTLGYDAPGGQQLTEDLRRAMRRVRRVHERRFYD